MDSTNALLHDEGIVIKKNLGMYSVRVDGRILPCKISSRLHKQLIYTNANPNLLHHSVGSVKELDNDDPIAVGDWVRLLASQNGSGMIVDVFPRRNKLVRRDPYPGKHKFEQVIVANVDYVIPVFAAANPAPKWSMLDPFLASAEALNLQALVVVSKIDLLRAVGDKSIGDLQDSINVYRRIGYPVILTSSLSGDGLDELRQILRDHTSVFVGKSGVGKTALLNALEPGLGLRIGEVGNGRIGKGKHTTTSTEMITTTFNASIVDLPGVREFGLHELDGYDLAWFFPEMRPFIGTCKFGLDCSHDEEPGCAIKSAVMADKISPLRYKSYLRIREEV